MRNTPVSPQYPGVEIHAAVIDNILSENFMSRPNWSRIYDLSAIIFMAIVPGLVLPRLSAVKGILFSTGLFALHIFVLRFLFVNYRLWLNMVYPLLVLALTYTGLTVYRYLTEERERKKIKGAFKHYVAPVVIENMLKDPDRLKLGGEEKVITVLFSDLAGFTSYSERYTPQQMITLLSEYYEKMTEEIFAHSGMLKEYVGDELMALFGAPLDSADHAKLACAAAIAMRERRHALGREWAAIGRPVLKARTGVNSGNMLVGNMGSSYRFSYGALGDNVNLGSRLEGLNKMYSTEIIVGENTANLLDGDFHLRELDRVRVKGKIKPVRVYELLAHSADVLSVETRDVVELYAAGLAAYYRQLWTDALQHFQKCTAILPGDGPSKVMAERCITYMQLPPGEDWDGVFEHLSK
jgi:adenylate cyclase